jgi:hypothetical protein
MLLIWWHNVYVQVVLDGEEPQLRASEEPLLDGEEPQLQALEEPLLDGEEPQLQALEEPLHMVLDMELAKSRQVWCTAANTDLSI